MASILYPAAQFSSIGIPTLGVWAMLTLLGPPLPLLFGFDVSRPLGGVSPGPLLGE